MKGRNRTVLMALPALALALAFWVMLLSPKREEAASLKEEITQLESEVAQQEQVADFAEQAREGFPTDYKKVVTLGKAVPQDDDTASLFAQLTGVSAQAGVQFRSLELVEASQAESGPAPPPVTDTPEESAPPAEGTDAPPSTPVATEETAASLPIGATIGPAGLPVMPYELQFQGDFFHVADFVAGLDRSVSTDEGNVNVDGRLLTIDGFALTRDPENDFPSLVSTFAITSYVTPAAEGLTAGATPTGPAPVSTPTPGTGTPAPTSSTEPTP
jgi:hypothetical protein